MSDNKIEERIKFYSDHYPKGSILIDNITGRRYDVYLINRHGFTLRYVTKNFENRYRTVSFEDFEKSEEWYYDPVLTARLHPEIGNILSAHEIAENLKEIAKRYPTVLKNNKEINEKVNKILGQFKTN